MATATAISIDDGAATPVTHVFSPIAASPGLSRFQDKSALTSAGRNELELAHSPHSKARATDRLKIRLNLPVEQTVDGITTVAFTNVIDCDIVIHSSSTQDDRNNVAAFAKNAIAHAVMQTMVEDLEAPF